MLMTAEQIKAEIAALDERIALAPEPTHAAEVLQLQQARRRRDMLQAELRNRSNQQKE